MRPQQMVRIGVLIGALAAVAVALVLVLGGGDDATPVAVTATPTPTPTVVPDQRFRSRPDLTPPTLQVTGKASGPVFLAPKRTPGQNGPMILNADGELVWFHPVP